MLQEENIQEHEIHLRDYVKIVLKRKWIIIASFIISLTFVTFYTFKVIPVYRATTKVVIDKENPNVLSFDEVLAMDSTGNQFYQTQYKVLGSRSLAWRVIKSMNLEESPEIKSGNKSGLINNYLGKLKVQPVRDSSIVNISFEGHNPQILARIANKHASEYIASNLDARFAASSDAVAWLRKQIAIKRELLEKAENTLQIYKEKKKIISLEGRQDIIVEKIEDLNSILTDARTKRMGLQTIGDLAKQFADRPEILETIPEVMENSLIQALKSEYTILLTKSKTLSKRYGRNYPAMIRSATEKEEMRARIDLEVGNVIKSIEMEYKVALSEEENISAALKEEKELALKLNRDAIAYGTLKRESDSERVMYNILLKRLKETDITGELQTSNIRILDAAEIPTVSIKPRKKKNITLGAMLGLIIGVGLVFFMEYLDNTIKSPEDIERYLSIPLLGVLEKTRFATGEKSGAFELVAHEVPLSNFTEAVRRVRTGIMFSIIHNHKKLIMVTSSVMGEGKTFIASNLAVVFAQTGKNTLLVDTDLRKPKLNVVFCIKRDPGLSNYLAGENSLESVVQSTKVPNLSVISCGVIPPNPSEILESTAMEKFCETVRERFDIVIFDTPPTMAVTDPVVLSKNMDGVIITIKSGVAVKNRVKRSISQIASSKCAILGAIVNYVDITKGDSYYHYYGNYYQAGYSSEDAKEETEKV